MAPRTTSKAKDLIAGLTEEQRAELLAELEAKPATPAGRLELTPRERVTAALLRERDHFDGCPVHGSEERAIARVEAYDEVRPAIPSKGQPATPCAVVRCIECGGMRYLDNTTVVDELRRALAGDDEVADGDLDGTIT